MTIWADSKSFTLDLHAGGGVQLHLCSVAEDEAVVSQLACQTPTQAIRAIECSLSGHEPGVHIQLLVRSPADTAAAWSTCSPGMALYWCALVLAKLWPPPRTPLVDRRNRDALSAHRLEQATPLLERREGVADTRPGGSVVKPSARRR